MRFTVPVAIQEAAVRLGYAGRGLQLIWKTSGSWNYLWAGTLVLQGLLPAGIVYITKRLVDSVAAAVGGGLSAVNVEPVLFPALVMGILLLLQQALLRLMSWIQAAQGELVEDKIKTLIQHKAVEVDYGFYESPEYFDKLQEANQQASTRTLGLLQNVGSLAQNGITFLSIAVILATYSIWLPFVLLLGTLPALVIVVRNNRIYHAWWKKTTADRRWANYLDYLFVEPHFAAELRLYDVGPQFISEYGTVRKRLRKERLRLIRQQTVSGLFAALQALLVTAGIMVWMIWRAFNGLATLGDLALFYQAISQGQSMMQSLLGSVGQIYANTLFLEHLFIFLELEPQQQEPEVPVPAPATLRHGITFSNVTFRYPGGGPPVLENFSLHLPAGKFISIVGSNGAGKSTLTKLLCRLYDPEEGGVELDGVDIRSFAKRELMDRISLMLQYPVRYQASAKENILLGARDASPEDLIAAAKEAGAHDFIERLPRQYDTRLGKVFPDGAELSGGEWQRIALARAYARKAPIVILDEPTSFMDSWAESSWLRRFKKAMAGRTVMVITHRFTTAMQADVIHVMEKGRIVESGTHQELLDLDGRYAASWRAQMSQAGQSVDLV